MLQFSARIHLFFSVVGSKALRNNIEHFISDLRRYIHDDYQQILSLKKDISNKLDVSLQNGNIADGLPPEFAR